MNSIQPVSPSKAEIDEESRRVRRLRDAQIIVGEVVLRAILIVVLADRVETHRDRQLRQLRLGRVRSGFFEGGLDPPAVFDVWLLRHVRSDDGRGALSCRACVCHNEIPVRAAGNSSGAAARPIRPTRPVTTSLIAITD